MVEAGTTTLTPQMRRGIPPIGSSAAAFRDSETSDCTVKVRSRFEVNAAVGDGVVVAVALVAECLNKPMLMLIFVDWGISTLASWAASLSG